MFKSLKHLFGLVGLVLWTAVPCLAQGSGVIPGADPPMIQGLSMEALERFPGVSRLFEVSEASGTPRIAPGSSYEPGEIIARFFLDVSDNEVQSIALQAGANEAVRLSPFGLFLLRGPTSDWEVEQIMENLAATGKAVLISPNYLGEGGVAFSPNDPHATSGAQWYLEAPSDIDLDLPQAWDITRGSSSVVVAVMDTGIRTSHTEFLGRLWNNPGEIPGNGRDDDVNGYVDDVWGWDSTRNSAIIEDNDGGLSGNGVGHGTWVSSVLLANANNGRQVAGFDHSARLLTVRSFNQAFGTTLAHILGGLDYLLATSQHYDVINMSWVDLTSQPGLGQSLDAMEQAGALVIAGAGNNGNTTNIWTQHHIRSQSR